MMIVDSGYFLGHPVYFPTCRRWNLLWGTMKWRFCFFTHMLQLCTYTHHYERMALR